MRVAELVYGRAHLARGAAQLEAGGLHLRCRGYARLEAPVDHVLHLQLQAPRAEVVPAPQSPCPALHVRLVVWLRAKGARRAQRDGGQQHNQTARPAASHPGRERGALRSLCRRWCTSGRPARRSFARPSCDSPRAARPGGRRESYGVVENRLTASDSGDEMRRFLQLSPKTRHSSTGHRLDIKSEIRSPPLAAAPATTSPSTRRAASQGHALPASSSSTPSSFGSYLRGWQEEGEESTA
jgi:hypothetical protein